MNNKLEEDMYTLSAFILGYILSNEFDSTMQNVVGNWFMLVGQTLCTSSAFNFNSDWNNRGNNNYNKMMDKIKNSINKL